jgi:RHS repeat-associated protein
VGVVETSADGVTTIGWTYDNLGRLTSETYDSYDDSLDYATTYVMDLVGNRLEKLTDVDGDVDMDEVVTYTYDANDRLLTETMDSDGDGVIDQTTAYTYGPTEQTSKTVTDEATGDIVEQTTYEYNVQGRLAKVTTIKDGQTTVTEFAYNDKGIRVSKTVDGQTANYVIDTNNHTGYAQVLEEHDAATGDVTKSFTIGHDVHVQWDEANGTVTLITDGHGSTRFTVDAAAGVVQRYDYDAYGNLLNSAFTPITDLLYCGEFFDATTGLQYLRARYYNPNTGRFNRQDTFRGRQSDPQSLHKYLYCHAGPIMGVDPSGMVTLAGFVQNLIIRSILFNLVMPLFEPAISYLIGNLVPEVIAKRFSTVPSASAFMIGGSVAGGLGRGSVSATRGLGGEFLTSSTTQAIYTYDEWVFSYGGQGGSLRWGAGIKAGVVFDAGGPSNYSGAFRSLTIRWSAMQQIFPIERFASLLSPVGPWISSSIVSSMSNPRFSQSTKELLKEIAGRAKSSVQFLQKIRNMPGDTVVSLFWDPEKYRPWGFSFARSFGNAGSYSYARQTYGLQWSNGAAF